MSHNLMLTRKPFKYGKRSVAVFSFRSTKSRPVTPSFCPWLGQFSGTILTRPTCPLITLTVMFALHIILIIGSVGSFDITVECLSAFIGSINILVFYCQYISFALVGLKIWKGLCQYVFPLWRCHVWWDYVHSLPIHEQLISSQDMIQSFFFI